MNAALGFQPASELPSSSSREQELEGIIKRQSEQLEKLQDELSAPSIRPDELQKLIILLNTFDGRIRELEGEVERQAIQIDDLCKEAKANVQEVYEVRTLLKDAVDKLKVEVASSNQFVERLADDIGNDRCRIKALEHPQRESEINRKRAEKIREYLVENGTPGKFLDKRTHKLVEGKAVRFELLRSYLDCDKWQLNRALRTLFQIHPGEYCKKKLNKTTWLLVERPKL
jgi:chromosome segregation ATPase